MRTVSRRSRVTNHAAAKPEMPPPTTTTCGRSTMRPTFPDRDLDRRLGAEPGPCDRRHSSNRAGGPAGSGQGRWLQAQDVRAAPVRRSRTWTAVVLGLALGGVVLTGCGSSGGSSTSSGSQAGGSVPAPAKEAAGSSAGADSGTSQGAPSATNAGGSKGGATTTPTAPDV